MGTRGVWTGFEMCAVTAASSFCVISEVPVVDAANTMSRIEAMAWHVGNMIEGSQHLAQRLFLPHSMTWWLRYMWSVYLVDPCYRQSCFHDLQMLD